jgi:hypothetical protein
VYKTTSSTTSSPFVSAVRSLLSFLPGQAVIRPPANIAFQVFGFTKLITRSSVTEAKRTSLVGLYSASVLRVRQLLAFSYTTVRSEAGDIYSGAKKKLVKTTPHTVEKHANQGHMAVITEK